MLYLIIHEDGTLTKTPTLTDDIMAEHAAWNIEIVRPNIFGDEVISYEQLNEDGEWEMVE